MPITPTFDVKFGVLILQSQELISAKDVQYVLYDRSKPFTIHANESG